MIKSCNALFGNFLKNIFVLKFVLNKPIYFVIYYRLIKFLMLSER